MPDLQDEAGTSLTPVDISRSSPAPVPTGGRRRLFVILGGAAASALVVDQLTKIWALAVLTPGEPIDVIGSVIRLNLVRNPGAAFSIGDRATWVLTVISLVIVVWVAVVARQVGTRSWAIGLGLLLGGAVGNLVDRVFRAPGPGRGHVVDFIDYSGWFVGNVADIAIVGAAGLVAVLSWRGIPVSGTARVDESSRG
ncbi:MAG: signal peptidase II [Dermatophilaceae bacterium]